MITGEPLPVEKMSATSDWRHGQWHRQFRHACRAGLQRHVAWADRHDGGRRPSAAVHPFRGLADEVAAVFVPWCWSFGDHLRCLDVAGAEPKLAHAIVNAVAVLIIACPCALAGDTHVHHGRRRTRRAEGVLVKNAEALERLEKVDTSSWTRPARSPKANPSSWMSGR